MAYSGLSWVVFLNYSLYGHCIIAIKAIWSRVQPIFRGNPSVLFQGSFAGYLYSKCLNTRHVLVGGN